MARPPPFLLPTLRRLALPQLARPSPTSLRPFSLLSPPRPSLFASPRSIFPLLPSHPFSRSYTTAPLASPPPTTSAPPPPQLSTPAVVKWLYLCSFLTFSIIVVGGLTRLTESGLSITEWRPVKGMLPPRGAEGWEVEFEKYRKSEEGMILNAQISLSEFKFIFYMEWAHRNLGRLIGVTFVLPAIYFASRGRLSKRDQWKCLALAGGIGFQGFLGWYMVSSGLDADHLSARPNSTPRVSQYRLAAHLGAALVLYVGMVHTAFAATQDWKVAHLDGKSGFAKAVEKYGSGATAAEMKKVLRFKRAAWAVAGLVLLTAVSGAFVAGLDAGLIYNEFPQMGEGIIPPLPELYNPKEFARRPDGKDGWWRNMLENPTTVQFDHRVLAVSTATLILLLTSLSHSPLLRQTLTRPTRRWASAASLVVIGQVTLGISTLIYLVPTPLAAMHQAGSVVLLTSMVGLLVSLRRPSAGARAWRKVRLGEVGVGKMTPTPVKGVEVKI